MEKEMYILVVEDDPVDAKAVRRMLEEGGIPCRSDTVQDLGQAKQKALSGRYDAVILDLGLPDSQGVDSVLELQATAPEIPVVVLTGSRDEAAALESVGLGAEDFLSKDSANRESLSRALRYAIERHRRKREAFQDLWALKLSLGQAKRRADTDPLTDLANRRGLQDYLAELNRSRPGRSLVAGLVDLDRFSEINDAHGHHVGDAVLKDFAARLLNCLGATDFAARIGGDEFVVIFEDSGTAQASAQAAALLEVVSSSPAGKEARGLSYSATFALAELSPPFSGLEQVLKETREPLARGKRGGGNRVECTWSREGGRAVKAAPVQELDAAFWKDLRIQGARQVRPLGAKAPLGQHLSFGSGTMPWSMTAGRARLARRLSEMTLNCVAQAQEWRSRHAPGALLHLDLESDAVNARVCAELPHLFGGVEDRRTCVLYLDGGFPGRMSEASPDGIRALRQAGFRLGMRNTGGGATVLEHLQTLAPEWLRFDPALTLHVGRYKEKAGRLGKMLEMLRPLGAAFVAEEMDGEADLLELEKLGFTAAFSGLILPGPADPEHAALPGA